MAYCFKSDVDGHIEKHFMLGLSPAFHSVTSRERGRGIRLGISNPLYRAEKLKARIQNSYLGRVSFWHPRYRSESELVYCNDVPKSEIPGVPQKSTPV